ncbi:hypothetical protein FTO74_07325 [Granulicella sp. WH15]|uniref:FUSC family protein n=1 Tax=Granulicella sp. WH15 TaxID=2602070 RepID=UPI001366C952|nr:FUSC family protein [Granulicella sp. WH15]QHN03202.1 hypothetical protein FTO74_07325 [Granulicella sp. WH15]
MPKTNVTLKIARTLQAELAPFPGRLSGSARDALGVTIALVLAMTLRVPGISLALALLFLLQRERPGVSLRSGLNIFGGAVLACAASLVWVQVMDGTEVARFFGLLLGVLVAGFCMAATTYPLLFTIFGFYGFVDLSSWDAHRGASAIVTSSLYNLASLGIVLLSAIAVEYLFGTSHPAGELQLELKRRLTVLSRFFHLLAMEEEMEEIDRDPALQSIQLRPLQNAILQYAHAGDRHLNKLYNRLRDGSFDIAEIPVGIHYRIGLLTRVLEKSALISLTSQRTVRDRMYFAVVAAQCDRLLNEESFIGEPLSHDAPAYLRELYSELLQYSVFDKTTSEEPAIEVYESGMSSSPFAGFFLPNAFQTADAAFYALKLTLAAMVCYVFYNAIAWPGILTCVVTVLFTGLSSTGAMKQKQIYRFSGAALGGALGITTVSFLFPNMDSITSLVLVVGTISLLSGWVLRSPRMGYVGVQIGFAFFLTTLPGFSAATLIAPARDRVIGIGIGILVMWFIFDQLWPVRTSTALGEVLSRIESAAQKLHLAAAQQDAKKTARALSTLRASVSLELANMQQLEAAVHFDFGPGHAREFAASRRTIRKIEAAAADFYATALHLTNVARE